LPPVERKMPDPGQYGFIETNLQKIMGGLLVAVPATLTYATGDFSQPFMGVPRDLPQNVLIALQWLVLSGMLAGILYLTIRKRAFPKRARGWVLFALGAFGVLICILLTLIINGLPGIIPPEQIVAGASTEIVKPNTDNLTPEQKQMAERGLYVYSTACVLCHIGNASGGQKNNAAGLGTMWSRNISPDNETGIGTWSEAQIARAIRSGVSKDGRPLMWQAMPWDHFGNLDEEDVRALAVYLKAIPPVKQAIPLPQPPASGDCAELTVWTQTNLKSGCQ
jgi:mono/diheme cytochrome c family protein